MADINYRDIPLLMSRTPQKINKAAAAALNEVAFQGRKSATNAAIRDMNFTGNPFRAIGFQIDKARSAGRPIQSSIFTNRKWLHYHISDPGTRKASSGIKFQGKRYLLIPHERASGFFTKKGRLKASAKRGFFIVRRRSGQVIALHRKKGSKQVSYIGALVLEADHNKDTNPEKHIFATHKRMVNDQFRKNLRRQGLRR
jgi:hypothetical protein